MFKCSKLRFRILYNRFRAKRGLNILGKIKTGCYVRFDSKALNLCLYGLRIILFILADFSKSSRLFRSRDYVVNVRYKVGILGSVSASVGLSLFYIVKIVNFYVSSFFQ